MKVWRIDFVPATVWPLEYLVAVGLAGVLAVSAMVSFSVEQRKLLAAQEALTQSQDQLAKRSGRTPQKASLNAPSLPKENLQAINAIVRQLNLPWDELFEALESTMPRKVAILEVNPDAKSRRLRVVAEVRNDKDMLAYLKLLRAVPLFESVVLTSHQVNEQDRNHPLHFEFMAIWKEDRP